MIFSNLSLKLVPLKDSITDIVSSDIRNDLIFDLAILYCVTRFAGAGARYMCYIHRLSIFLFIGF